MFAELWLAVGLGVAYAATPGAVNTECLRRGMLRGFRPALSVQVGALLGDGVWAIVALSGAAVLAQREAVGLALGVVGGLFLCRLAFAALRQAWLGHTGSASVASAGGDLRTGAVFGLANPAGIAFWAGFGGGALATSGGDIAALPIVVGAFLGGALGWSVGFSLLVSWGRRFARPPLLRAIDAVCGVVLGVFGVRVLWSTLRRVWPALPRFV